MVNSTLILLVFILGLLIVLAFVFYFLILRITRKNLEANIMPIYYEKLKELYDVKEKFRLALPAKRNSHYFRYKYAYEQWFDVLNYICFKYLSQDINSKLLEKFIANDILDWGKKESIITKFNISEKHYQYIKEASDKLNQKKVFYSNINSYRYRTMSMRRIKKLLKAKLFKSYNIH